MTRRLGLASLLVVVFAFAGPAAGPVTPIQSLRASVVWLNAPEPAAHETLGLAPRVAPPIALTISQLRRSAGFRWPSLESRRFQRPPPSAL